MIIWLGPAQQLNEGRHERSIWIAVNLHQRFRGIESSSDATWDHFQDGEGGPQSDDLLRSEKPAAAKPAAKAAKTKEEDDFIQKF